MLVYIDASILVAIVRKEPTRSLFKDQVDPGTNDLIVTDLCVAETSAALAARVRQSSETWAAGSENFVRADRWIAATADKVAVVPEDVAFAVRAIRRPDIVLRAPDAIHIAAAHRLGATLLTLDRGMARAAAALRVSHIHPAEADAPGEPKD